MCAVRRNCARGACISRNAQTERESDYSNGKGEFHIDFLS